MNSVLAWHFVGDCLRDGRPIPADGVTLHHTGSVVPCESGLHASVDAFDALQYAPGSTLCLVRCSGTIIGHGYPQDKIACSKRTILARMDFTEPLRYYARMQALGVADKWPAPDVVLDYLMTGDESIRDAAWAAAWAAAWDAARYAARYAARDTAWYAAWYAAWAAAWAARYAAWDAARYAARDAARDAAWAAARDAAGYDAGYAARDAAWAAARTDFNQLVRECFEMPLRKYQ
jgi:hypothetical protein